MPFAGVSDARFHYKSGFLKELFKANFSFRIFYLTEEFAVKTLKIKVKNLEKKIPDATTNWIK